MISATVFIRLMAGLMLIPFVLLTVSLTTVSTENKNSTLQFVIVVSRHGSRGPLFHFKTDPYKDSKYWPDGSGALTAKGKYEMFKLGQYLRIRYNDTMLDDIYKPEDIYIKSTQVTRTYMSCASLLAGMFPPKEFQVWNPNIHWQPIPIWPDSYDKSDVVMNTGSCPSFEADQQLMLLKTKSYMKVHKNLFNYLTLHSGTQIKQLPTFFHVWDPLHCESGHGYQLPSWTNSVFPKRMRPIASYMYNVMTCGTKRMNRLLSGPLIKNFNTWINSKINGSITQKMLLHSGHDFTIVGLKKAVGYTDNFTVEPASALIIELHQTSIGHHIEMHYYNGTYTEKPELMNMPNCPHPCSLQDFLKMTNETEMEEDDWHAACNSGY